MSIQMAHVRRHWWLVLLVVVLSVVASTVATIQAQTTYTGRASLIVNSKNRAPDQDAILVQGYVDYFNDSAYQTQLLGQVGYAGKVALGARAAAASPIMLVEATATSAEVAKKTASDIAQAFRSDINKEMDRQQADLVDKINTRLQALKGTSNPDASTVASLETQIADIESDQTNRLQPLQLNGGVSVTRPNVVSNVVLGLMGGLLLGVMAALIVGSRPARSGAARGAKRPRRQQIRR